jgi:hypothetical protein
MYSPKIKETLIPLIYRAAKAQGIPMTRWVNRILEEALSTDVPETDPDKDGEGAIPGTDAKNTKGPKDK